MTELNRPVMEDEKLWDQIMELTPLKRWMSVEEAAEWITYGRIKTASVQVRTFSLMVWRPETAILSGHRVGLKYRVLKNIPAICCYFVPEYDKMIK